MCKPYVKALFICCFLSMFSVAVAQSARRDERPLETDVALYPPIARAAHLEGDIELKIHVREDGAVSDVTVASGPEWLRETAVAYVKKWKYAGGSEGSRNLSIHYRVVTPLDGYNSERTPEAHVSIESVQAKLTVTITTQAVMEKSRSNCPEAGDSAPPIGEGVDDYVELSRSPCFGSCPAYTVRVAADGGVSWKGEFAVNEKKERRAEISAAEARRLIEAFRVADFWKACRNYSASVTDSASDGLEVQINGRKKIVEEYADSAPDFVDDLQNLVDSVSDSHRWRVGDPKAESLADISRDSWLPKPGKTKLMLAVQGEPKDVEAALAAGDKLTDVDSSGWTPLMYAASAYGGANVKLLLREGAAVNARGPRGETALMFAALDGRADQDLLGAGAEVNASTRDGVTVLMLAAQRGDAEAIAALLKAGAKVSARDVHGRTAMDYLEAANCGNRLVEESIGSMTGHYSCNALGKDEFKRAHVALERAGSRHTRVWHPKR